MRQIRTPSWNKTTLINVERKGKMKREEVKAKLISWGVAEPTDEQISDYLAQINKETKSAEDRANRYKADADKVKELTEQLDALNSANMTELEKANKATEDALAKVASLEKTVKSMELTKSLAEIGIVGDDAIQLVNEDGSLNTSKLGEILKGREESAVSAYKERAIDETPSPNGGNPPEEDKAVNEFAKSYVERVKNETASQEIVNQYI